MAQRQGGLLASMASGEFDAAAPAAASAAAPALVYDGSAVTVPGLPTRADVVRSADTAGLSAVLEAHIAENKDIYFLPNDVVEENQYTWGAPPVYKLHLFGVLPNGSKAHVVIDGIEVYFDVRVPVRHTAKAFSAHLRETLGEHSIEAYRIEHHEAFPLRGYRKTKVAWLRLHFPNTQDRKKAIEIVRGLDYETASDDRSSYYRMAARVYGYVLTDWGLLSKYEYFRGGANAAGGSYAENEAAKQAVLARHRTSTAAKADPEWRRLRDCADRIPNSPLCEHVFRVDARDFRPLVDPAAPKDIQEQQSELRRRLPLTSGAPDSVVVELARDKTLVMTWDTETRSTAGTGAVPDAKNPTDHVFLIGATFHWKDDPEPLHSVCIVDVDTVPDARWTTITCGTEENVIRAFAAVFRHFAPDIIVDFNGGNYDWPFVLTKAQQFACLSFMFDAMTALPRGRPSTEAGVLKWNVNTDKTIKISAEASAQVTFLKVPGCVPVDVRVMFQQLFPKAEVGKGSSLSFYLKACNLSAKADMPYKRMWQIRDAEDAAQMRLVAHYCVIDAKRCQELLVKRSVVNDRREVAALSYVSFYDAVYYAGGHKVCNMLAAYAIRRGLLCSNINNDEAGGGKYPGAWVFHPEKGLVPDPTEASTAALEAARAEYLEAPADSQRRTAAKEAVTRALSAYQPGRPVTGLDFSSLYPMIIMTYNLSPEKFVEDPAEARGLQSEGAELHRTDAFLFQGRTVRESWFVRHGGDPENYGLYPSILIDLFDKRAAMKKKLAVQEELKEHMEIVLGLVDKGGDPGANAGADFLNVLAEELAGQRARREELEAAAAAAPTPKKAQSAKLEAAAAARIVEYLEAVAAKPAAERQADFLRRYRETCFEFGAINSKQKALKVFMNTFYGEAGNQRSPFFLLQLAGGVTLGGQYNIKMVADFVRTQGFKIKYGDTDSLYLCAPDSCFAEADRRYAFGLSGGETKEAYWTEMVQITMETLDSLRDLVNDHLRADNGTKFLRMAYEEVLYPVVFTGKKKYFGIAHINVPNFHPKKLFVRGIDVVKLGQTELAKKIGYRIMWAAMAVANAKSLQTIVEDVLQDAVENTEQWTFDDFIQTDAWKPTKDNKSVQRFIARMKVRAAEERAENDRREGRGSPRRKELYYIPDPGERFRYVLVKPAGAFDLRGYKSDPKKGDMMEYAEVARELGMPINVGQYLSSYVVGLCARFINYSEQFLPPVASRPGLDDKALDKKAQDAAKKYLTSYIAGLQGVDAETVSKRGYAYKRAWKAAAQECSGRLFGQLGPAAEVLHGDRLDWSDFLPDGDEEVVAALAHQAKTLAEESFADAADQFLGEFCKAAGIAPDGSDLQPPEGGRPAARLYSVAATFTRPRRGRGRARPSRSLHEYMLSALDRAEAEGRAGMAALAPAVGDIAARYEACLARVVDAQRAAEHQASPETLGAYAAGAVNDADAAGAANDAADAAGAANETILPLEADEFARLEEVRRRWYALAGIYRAREQVRAIPDHLADLKRRRQQRAVRPDRAEVQRAIAASAARLPAHGAGAIGDGNY